MEEIKSHTEAELKRIIEIVKKAQTDINSGKMKTGTLTYLGTAGTIDDVFLPKYKRKINMKEETRLTAADMRAEAVNTKNQKFLKQRQEVDKAVRAAAEAGEFEVNIFTRLFPQTILWLEEEGFEVKCFNEVYNSIDLKISWK